MPLEMLDVGDTALHFLVTVMDSIILAVEYMLWTGVQKVFEYGPSPERIFHKTFSRGSLQQMAGQRFEIPHQLRLTFLAGFRFLWPKRKYPFSLQ
jgi:hypothetical protein